MATTNNQNSAANYLPFLRYKSLTNVAWETTGNSMTINDVNVHSNSLIVIVNTSARNGLWYISSQSEGQFVITSSDSESATTTTFKYMNF